MWGMPNCNRTSWRLFNAILITTNFSQATFSTCLRLSGWRQTAINEETGTPDDGSLRSSRVLLRETELYAPLEVALSDNDPTKEDTLALLSACVAALHRGGIGRNRGRGRLKAQLEGVNMDRYLEQFEFMTRSSH